jgi:hypothetical protein
MTDDDGTGEFEIIELITNTGDIDLFMRTRIKLLVKDSLSSLV